MGVLSVKEARPVWKANQHVGIRTTASAQRRGLI